MWVLLLAAGGFIGNFVLSLADHAQNGFFAVAECVPVVSSAIAVGFLLAPTMVEVDRGYLKIAAVAVLLWGEVRG